MSETKTFRGRSLEDVLPQIRAELGPDALVLKRREGLAGGVGGFFQHPFIEVEARAPVAEPEVEVRTDRATAEGLATPAMQELLAQASPFAARLAEASGQDSFGLYGPQPAAEPMPETPAAFVADTLPAAPAEAGLSRDLVAPAPTARLDPPVVEPEPAPEPEPAAHPRADTLRASLEAAGLSHAVATEAVDEAVRHGVPFASPRALKTLVRAAVTRRIPVMAPPVAGPRTVAIVGGSGAGKTTAAARLAAAYRGAGTIAVRELTADDPALRTPFDGLTVVDAPATGVRDTEGVKLLAKQLRGLKAEVHLAVPATMSAPAAADLAAALAPLKPTHVLLTHADETDYPGPVIAHAIAAARPLSYVSGADALLPADGADLAKRLCK